MMDPETELLEQRRADAGRKLREAVVEHMDAWQLLDDGDQVDDFVVCSRVVNPEPSGVAFFLTSDVAQMPIDRMIGLLTVCQRQQMAQWEHWVAHWNDG